MSHQQKNRVRSVEELPGLWFYCFARANFLVEEDWKGAGVENGVEQNGTVLLKVLEGRRDKNTKTLGHLTFRGSSAYWNIGAAEGKILGGKSCRRLGQNNAVRHLAPEE